MASYSIRADETELAALVTRAEAGEEIVLSRDGHAVAKIIPFPVAGDAGALETDVQRRLPSGDGLQASSPAGANEELPPLDETRPIKRRGGQNLLGLAGTDLSWLDEPLPEDMQRAFGMID